MADSTAEASKSGVADSPEDLRAALWGTILFADLNVDQIDHIGAAGSPRELQRGTVLFEQGDEPHEFYLLLEGRIGIEQESIDGRISLLSVLAAGELFGELGFLDGHSRSAQARALEDSRVFEIPYSELRQLYESSPRALWSAVELLAGRLRATDEALSDTVFLDVMGRTAKRLLEMSGGADTFEMPLTQEELASMVGASRERVNRAIRAFTKLGWISHNQRHYKIKSRTKLQARAR